MLKISKLSSYGSPTTDGPLSPSAVLSLVSSSIKRVGTSPPKEGFTFPKREEKTMSDSGTQKSSTLPNLFKKEKCPPIQKGLFYQNKFSKILK